MIKRTVVLSSATGMLLTMFSSFGGNVLGAGSAHAVTVNVLDWQRPSQLQIVCWQQQVILQNRFSLSISQHTHEPYLQLLKSSGFEQQLKRVPLAVSRNIENAVIENVLIEPFEPSDIEFLKQAVPAAFNADLLQKAVLRELRAELSVNSASQLIRFFSTATGSLLRDAELNNSILEHADRFNRWHENHGIASLSIERQAAIADLERAMQAAKGAVDAMIGMQVALQVNLTPVLPIDQQRSATELLTSAQTQRASLTRIYRQSSMATLAFVFQFQTVDELRAYSAMLGTEAGQRYVIAINNGLSRGLILAAEQLGHSIRTLLADRIGQGV